MQEEIRLEPGRRAYDLPILSSEGAKENRPRKNIQKEEKWGQGRRRFPNFEKLANLSICFA